MFYSNGGLLFCFLWNYKLSVGCKSATGDTIIVCRVNIVSMKVHVVMSHSSESIIHISEVQWLYRCTSDSSSGCLTCWVLPQSPVLILEKRVFSKIRRLPERDKEMGNCHLQLAGQLQISVQQEIRRH